MLSSDDIDRQFIIDVPKSSQGEQMLIDTIARDIEKIGGSGRNRTGVDGFAIRCITTLPPSLGV